MLCRLSVIRCLFYAVTEIDLLPVRDQIVRSITIDRVTGDRTAAVIRTRASNDVPKLLPRKTQFSDKLLKPDRPRCGRRVSRRCVEGEVGVFTHDYYKKTGNGNCKWREVFVEVQQCRANDQSTAFEITIINDRSFEFKFATKMLSVLVIAFVATISGAHGDVTCGKSGERRSSFVCENATLNDVKTLPRYANSIEMLNSRNDIIAANSFAKFDHLKSLGMINCSVSNIESFAFGGLGSLKILNLSRNALTRIEAGAFVGLAKLEKLDLSYNSIEIIGNRSFDELASIRIINLKNNNLTTVDANVLRALSRAATLDIRFNNVRCIGTDIFHDTKLKWFYVGNNPWNDTCWFAMSRYLYHSGIYYGKNWAFDSLTEDRLLWNMTSLGARDSLAQHQAEEKAEVAREAEGWKQFYELVVDESADEKQRLNDLSAAADDDEKMKVTVVTTGRDSSEPSSSYGQDLIVWIISLAKLLNLWS